MHVGANLIVNQDSPSIIDIAVRAEERRIESIFQGEHTHTPVSTASPVPSSPSLPDFYRKFPDVFITLAAAASVTRMLRVGTGVVLVAEHSPLRLAKAVATLDQLSAGRVEFGVGYGWNAPELANNGVPWTLRREVFGEKLAVIKRLWTEEVVAHRGRHVSFTDSWLWPKPVQVPHPPVLIGGGGSRATLRDVIEYADGWYPPDSDQLPGQIDSLRGLARDAGRSLPSVSVNILAGQREGVPWYWQDHRERDRLWRRAEEYRAHGVHRIVVGVPMDSLASLSRALDALADLAARVV